MELFAAIPLYYIFSQMMKVCVEDIDMHSHYVLGEYTEGL